VAFGPGFQSSPIYVCFASQTMLLHFRLMAAVDEFIDQHPFTRQFWRLFSDLPADA